MSDRRNPLSSGSCAAVVPGVPDVASQREGHALTCDALSFSLDFRITITYIPYI